MSQKYNIIFYAIIVALVLVLPGQAVAVEDACSFIQDVNERVACEAQPFPRPCDIIQNVNDRENCKKFNERIGDGTPLLHSDGPPPWCTGPKGRECENDDGTPIEPPKHDACATIQDVNERLACQSQSDPTIQILGAGNIVHGGSQAAEPEEVCNFISDPDEKKNCEGIPSMLFAFAFSKHNHAYVSWINFPLAISALDGLNIPQVFL